MLKAEIESLKLNVPGEERNILSGINFQVDENSIFTILGKNGSGKSTLMKSLTGLLDNRFYKINGKVFFNNVNLFSADEKTLIDIRKNKIKYVFQDAVNSFDHLKTFEYYFEKIVKDKSGIDEHLDYFLLPPKEKLFKLYPYEVSGGMAQRISFVHALLAHPQLIILDEPTSGIDYPIANLFLLKLKEFVKTDNNSVLLVTQDVSFAEEVSDRIVYLSDGKLSEDYSVLKL